MNCPRCQKPIAPGATYCPNCGLPLQAAPGGGAAAMAMQGAFDSQKRRNRTLVIILAILAVIAAIFGGLMASGVLQLGGRTGPNSLQASGSKPNAVLGLSGKPGPAVTSVVGQAGPEMPKDVRDWLEHLRRCEELKRELTVDMNSEMKAILHQLSIGISSVEDVQSMSDPDSDISKGPHADLIGDMTRRMKIRWTDLSDQFRKFAPPAECKPIADSFDGGVNGLAAEIDQLGDLVSSWNATDQNASADLSRRKDAAERIGRTHTSNVDDNFKDAEKGLEDVCAKYGVKPWFSIDASGNVGGTLGNVNTTR